MRNSVGGRKGSADEEKPDTEENARWPTSEMFPLAAPGRGFHKFPGGEGLDVLTSSLSVFFAGFCIPSSDWVILSVNCRYFILSVDSMIIPNPFVVLLES